jgi:fatty acid desaturase
MISFWPPPRAEWRKSASFASRSEYARHGFRPYNGAKRGQDVTDGAKAKAAGPEWPTVFLVGAVYLLFGLTTTLVAEASVGVAILLTGVVIAQYSSLQHEVLHGHPFASQGLNEALVYPGLTLFVPYQRFRESHLAHHHDERLTDPYDDPESNYMDPAVWHRLSRPLQRFLRFNNRLLGRMLVGPMISTWRMVTDDWAQARAGNHAVTRAWLHHGVGVALVIWWLLATGQMPLWAFGLAAYLGYSLLKVRTFLEHRAHERASGRTVVVEDKGPLALLYLNNNYHVVHHMHPKVAWYRLPAIYRENRDHYLRRNDTYVYRSYGDIFRRYFLHAKDPVPHPLWKPPSAD